VNEEMSALKHDLDTATKGNLEERSARALEKIVSEKNLEKNNADQIKIVHDYQGMVSNLESDIVMLNLQMKDCSDNITDLKFELGKSKEEYIEEVKRHEIERIDLNDNIAEHLNLLKSLKSQLNDLDICKQVVDAELLKANTKNTDLICERAKDKLVLKALNTSFCLLKSIQNSLVVDITEFSTSTLTILTKLDEQDISYKESEKKHELLKLSLWNEKEENITCKINLEKSQTRF
jgi:hypothetical protein